MASGINSTFRQVGIATGIGALGSIFQHNQSANLAAGQPRDAAFIGALNDILLVGAIVALVAGVLALALIRSKDFAEGSQAAREPEGGAPSEDATPEPASPPVHATGNGASLDALTRRVESVILAGERAAGDAEARVEADLAEQRREARRPLDELEQRRLRLTILLAERLRQAERQQAEIEATRRELDEVVGALRRLGGEGAREAPYIQASSAGASSASEGATASAPASSSTE
jgi:hypothetical protein